jgi:hypothetical protein
VSIVTCLWSSHDGTLEEDSLNHSAFGRRLLRSVSIKLINAVNPTTGMIHVIRGMTWEQAPQRCLRSPRVLMLATGT